jgi:capsid protein
MEEAVATGRLAAPGFFPIRCVRQAYLGANWIGPREPRSIRYKEAQADAIDVRNGVKTREQICLERTGGRIEEARRASSSKRKKLAGEIGCAGARRAPVAPAMPATTATTGDADAETKPGAAA